MGEVGLGREVQPVVQRAEQRVGAEQRARDVRADLDEVLAGLAYVNAIKPGSEL